MAQSTATNIIENTFEAVSRYSYQSKVRSEEEQLDQLFDTVNRFRSTLASHSLRLEELIEPIESLIWFKNLNENDLIKISNIISVSRDIISDEKKEWAALNKWSKKTKFCTQEIQKHKHIIDDLAEAINNLYEVIFENPNDSEFQKLNQELQLLIE